MLRPRRPGRPADLPPAIAQALGVPSTNAERQAEFRRRHLQDVDGDCARLNAIVSITAKAKLDRLARHYGVTRRAMLESLLAEAEQEAVSGMKRSEERTYFDDHS